MGCKYEPDPLCIRLTSQSIGVIFIYPDAEASEQYQGLGLRYSDDGVCSSADAASAGAIRASAFGQAAPIPSNAAFPSGESGSYPRCSNDSPLLAVVVVG